MLYFLCGFLSGFIIGFIFRFLTKHSKKDCIGVLHVNNSDEDFRDPLLFLELREDAQMLYNTKEVKMLVVIDPQK